MFIHCSGLVQQAAGEAVGVEAEEDDGAVPTGRAVQRGDAQADEVPGVQDDAHPAQQDIPAQHLLQVLCIQKVRGDPNIRGKIQIHFNHYAAGG